MFITYIFHFDTLIYVIGFFVPHSTYVFRAIQSFRSIATCIFCQVMSAKLPLFHCLFCNVFGLPVVFFFIITAISLERKSLIFHKETSKHELIYSMGHSAKKKKINELKQLANIYLYIWFMILIVNGFEIEISSFKNRTKWPLALKIRNCFNARWWNAIIWRKKTVAIKWENENKLLRHDSSWISIVVVCVFFFVVNQLAN